MPRKLKLIRDDIGCCICEDCAKYVVANKSCLDNRQAADAPDKCSNYIRGYEAGGLNVDNKAMRIVCYDCTVENLHIPCEACRNSK